MKKKYVELNYLLSLFLILTGIVYFFASNWQEFDRLSKVGLSVGLMLLFYAGSFVIRKLIKQHYFLSHWLLVSGSVGFGITLALLGQIYNSHADSYRLFGVWLIPMLLFSYVTKYQVFYFFSYVLFNLSFWFYMNPSSVIIERTPGQETLIYLGIALFNLLLFWMSGKGIFQSPTVKYSSFVVFHALLLGLSQTHLFNNGEYHNIIALVYFIFSLGLIYFHTKKEQNKISLSITIAFTALLVFSKTMTWLLLNASSLIFVIALFGVVGLIAGSVILVNFLNKKAASTNSIWMKYVRSYTISSITFIASTIGAASIIGLIVLTVGWSEYLIFFLGIVFIAAGFFVNDNVPTIKYSLITIGYLISGGTSFVANDIVFVLFLIGLVFMLFVLKNQAMVILTYGFLNLLSAIKLSEVIDSVEISLLAFSIVNLLVYFLTTFENNLKRVALAFGYVLFIGLTFFDNNHVAYIAYNLLFFIGITFMVYWTKKTDKKVEYYVSLIAWFGFVAIKYYDFAWDLIHKSIVMIILGIALGIIAKKMDKEHTEDGVSFIDTKKKPLLFMVGLQLITVLSLSVYHESILKNGQEIKVELQPVDPRSLLQGDYVILSYKISNITIDELQPKEKVEVLLRENKNGVYEYANNYKHDGNWKNPYEPQEEDIIINGRYNGYNGVYYGIESYFVPEGTGLEVENKTKFALVKVGKNQNALLVDLLEK
ncbi:GDYXXLXY domain-containing protein [Peribacillus loiseleuriae]|uniref:GDYXXLXY domain-containing protein n=1 Tax=Peribacillus loiseleuriae TaxID=1679170 RepID=UPI00382A6B5E